MLLLKNAVAALRGSVAFSVVFWLSVKIGWRLYKITFHQAYNFSAKRYNNLSLSIPLLHTGGGFLSCLVHHFMEDLHVSVVLSPIIWPFNERRRFSSVLNWEWKKDLAILELY